MSLSELNPFPAYVIWKEEAIELKPFSLRAITWAERFFYVDNENGFDRMNRLLRDGNNQKEQINTIIDVTYYLGIEDFQSVGVSCPVGLKKSFRENENLEEIVEMFKIALETVFRNSFPDQVEETEINGGEVYKKLVQSEKQGPRNETKWDQIYVAFYMAGGMSINEFYNLTMKQIEILYPELEYKTLKNLEYTGVKFKQPIRRKQKTIKPKFSNNEIAAFEKMQNELMKENRVN